MPGIDSFTKGCWHCDGANASTDFPDASSFNHDLTATSNAKVDTEQFKFGGAAALLFGSGDRLRADGHADFALGTGDFVIDFWVRSIVDNGFTQVLVDFVEDIDTDGSLLIYLEDQKPIFYSDGVRIDGGSVVSAHVTNHFALVRSSGTTRMFLNGMQVGSDFTDSRNYTVDANCPAFGGFADGTEADELFGWLDEIRISKGTDRGWSGGFTPPVAAYSPVIARSQAAIVG